MTEQPDQQKPQTEKLLIDNPQNFQFHAAYLVYSDAFDKADEAGKQALNRNLQELSENKMSVETFYVNIASFRRMEVPRPERFSMQTQRKKDWRRKEQRQDRIKRHKK